jgi:hypothetical protein
LFAILRRTAGNYGRLAVIRKEDDESKWTQVFFQTEVGEEGDTIVDGPSAETDSLERGLLPYIYYGKPLIRQRCLEDASTGISGL